MRLRSLLLVLPLLVALSACDSNGSADERLVAGFDFDVLFAPATASEISAIEADWASRDVGVYGLQEELEAQITAGTGSAFTVRVLSHEVTGQRHYGAVVVPDGAAPGSLPVMMYLHGGDAGVSVDGETLFIGQFMADLFDEFIWVVPSFRDEPLRFGGQTWQSEGPASPWDYDVDDAMALLTAALDTTPEADPTRIASMGLSRGGGVAFLMAARDSRIKQVVDFFGPTDFFGPFVQDVAEETLLGSPSNLPGVDFMNENFLIPLREGQLSIQNLRPELVRRSAVLYVNSLPPVQLHHGIADTVVPVGQAELMIAAMNDAGKRSDEFDGHLYEGGEHNPITLVGAFDRVITFVRPLVEGS